LKQIYTYAIIAIRQKDVRISMRTKNEIPEKYRKYLSGILLFFYSGKAPTRLFVALVVTVQPFDDVVASYTSHNSD